VANMAVNGSELHPGDFGGGAETNTFLEKLGFEIVPSNHEADLQDNDTNIQVRIVTAVIENQNGRCPENKERLNFMAESSIKTGPRISSCSRQAIFTLINSVPTKSFHFAAALPILSARQTAPVLFVLE